MNPVELDILIPLKPSDDNEELRYTLRAISRNMPCRKIFLVGYQPSWVTNVEYIKVSRSLAASRYTRIEEAIQTACMDPRLSDNFIRLDDDMFVVRPIDNIQPMHQGTIEERAAKLKRPNAPWGKAFGRTRDMLRQMGIKGELYSYELHMPILFNKEKLLALYQLERELNPAKEVIHIRTLYGNYYQIGGQRVRDTKIATPDNDLRHNQQDTHFISTADTAFEHGEVGRYIRKLFPDPCKYEQLQPAHTSLDFY